MGLALLADRSCFHPSTKSLKEAASIVRITALIYLAAIHLALLILLVKTDAVPRLETRIGLLPRHPLGETYADLLTFEQRQIEQTDDQVIFIGDSITAGQNTSAICANSLNFGIGGDTLAGVAYRIAHLNLSREKAIVIAIGTNDWRTTDMVAYSRSYGRMIDAIPHDVMIFAVSPLPLSSAQLQIYDPEIAIPTLTAMRKAIAAECGHHTNCTYIDTANSVSTASGEMREDFNVGDGVHPNAAGYAAIARKMKNALATVCQ